MAKRGIVDGERLKQLKGAVGFRNLATDLVSLGALVRENWTAIGGKTALSLADLDKAEVLGDRILTAVGLREQGPAVVAEAADIRQRAFSLFASAYDEARRAVNFLRWNEDDADTIAPSLYGGRSRRKAADPVPAPAPAGGTSAGAGTGTGTAGTAGAPTAPVPTGTAGAPVGGGTTVPASGNGAPVTTRVGLPQSEPFVRQ